MNEKDSLKTQKLIVGLFSILLIVILIIVAGVEMKESVSPEPVIEVSGISERCVNCHTNEGVAVKAIDHWKQSMHAEMNISCIDCHEAEEGDFDAFFCPESDIRVAKHPTPKDCAECHEEEVTEFAESKHAHQFWLFKNADRSVFEFPSATRHGCEQCHNIVNMWPDGSVGECDVCHPKHTFSKAVARQPETCGECHLGPDHPHIEIYHESKHGNIFRATEKNMDLAYNSEDHDQIPIDVPVCTTCHMDAVGNQDMTHNVSERLAWESQSPWSFRTVWEEEKLGDWKMKRERMESVCKSCHSPDFMETYLLTSDIVNLQYNEIRREFVYWTNKLTDTGIIDRLEVDGKYFSDPVLNGFDEVPEEKVYYTWHHEGRRFRHGAMMMGADYTQWLGIWEMQEDLVEMITWAAEKGDPEAEKWVKSNHPGKFVPFALYDIPGTAWGISTHTNTTPFVYNNYDDYWDRVYQNVKKAYDEGMLAKDQWELWVERYEEKEHYLGTKYTERNDSLFQHYQELNEKDFRALQKQGVDLDLPGDRFWDYDN